MLNRLSIIPNRYRLSGPGKAGNFNFLFFIVCVFLVLIVPDVHASTYIAIEDPVVYDLLTRLEAQGVIRSGLLNTKPISRKEAARLLHEAEENSANSTAFVKSLVSLLNTRLGPDPSLGTTVKPLDTIYVKYAYINTGIHSLKYNHAIENEQPLNINNNGDIYKKGSDERIGFTSRLDDWGPLSIEVNPEFRHPETPFTEERFVTKKAYGVVDLWGWDAVVGQDSQWWGPGYHGALLLTNNAEPFTFFKFTNPEPVHLPWIFKYLGPFRLNAFIANPQKIGIVDRPYIYGIKFDFKPHPNFEMGFEKTALIGGKGRALNYHDWINSMLPFSDSENRQNQDGGDPGDQRVGVDFKYTVPWKAQPLQIYLEAAGEDEYQNLPTDWAFVGGFYLPRILSAENFDFRLEFATTRGKQLHPYQWYVHYAFGSYTYKGNIIGHHIGTDSSDWFAQVSYLVPEKDTRLFLAYDREEHDLYVAGSHETLYSISAGVTKSLAGRIDLKLDYSRGWLYNLGNAPGGVEQLSAFGVELGYKF